MNKPKLTFELLTVETTRRCNMQCTHCVRGDAQNIDIDYKHIDDLLDQTEIIGNLYIAGGEPTLNLDALEYILNGLCKRGIPLLEFNTYSNGLIYSERFINIVKWCKQIINVSCSNCLIKGHEYQPLRELSRCSIGISLDRYHEQHNICMEHYQKYKAALSDFADVRMIMMGNNPKNFGRARNLELPMLNMDSIFELSKKQRIELLSKDHTPICPNYNSYRMFDENQKIVCCQIYMNVYGLLSSELGGLREYQNCDMYPKICTASDPIWDSIIKYNKDKIPCVKFQKLKQEKMQEVFSELPFETLLKILDRPDSKDEQTHYLKMIEAEQKEKNERLAHPKTFLEAITNFNVEYRNYLKAQENLQKAREHANKNWAQIIAEANHHSYYSGDKRSNVESQTSTDQKMRPAVKCQDGLRCWNCGKVIQTTESRNIHCVPTEQGLKCQYCHSINTAKNATVTHK